MVWSLFRQVLSKTKLFPFIISSPYRLYRGETKLNFTLTKDRESSRFGDCQGGHRFHIIVNFTSPNALNVKVSKDWRLQPILQGLPLPRGTGSLGIAYSMLTPLLSKSRKVCDPL
jgi:hypothetical protein